MQTVVQIGLNLFNVILLAVVLSWLLYKPVRNFLQKRSDRIKGQLEQAGNEMVRASELKAQYEQKMKDVEHEREGILDEARKLAAESSRQILADAKKEADAVRARAAANVEMEWDRAQTQMREAIIDVSAAMTEKFLLKALDDAAHNKLFSETMAELEEMAWRN